MSPILQQTLLLILTAMSPLRTSPSTPPAAAGCEVKIMAEDRLGNFEIQFIRIQVDARKGDGQEFPAETHSVALRVAPNGQARTKVTINSPCSVTRKMKIEARAKSLSTNETIDVVGVWQDDWYPVEMVARFSR